MIRWTFLLTLALSGCGGIAGNTLVARDHPVRQAMAASVVPGQTTEVEFITRWGRPVAKVREGGQVEYIYRDIRDQPPGDIVRHGDSTRYVIVTFQYGRAVGVRTSDDEGCRATFPPRPPGPNWDNPFTVHPLPTCPGLYRPGPGGGTGAGGGDAITDDAYHPGGKAG